MCIRDSLWAPEMHRINNKWYIYFAADDGNMDNHQIYVIENEADIPTEGKFVMKGRIPVSYTHLDVYKRQPQYSQNKY